MSQPDVTLVTLYTTTWCPYCQRLVENLDSTATPYTRIDVEDNPNAGQWVESVNDGNRIVPTVQFADGTYLTNPDASVVRAKYKELATHA